MKEFEVDHIANELAQKLRAEEGGRTFFAHLPPAPIFTGQSSTPFPTINPEFLTDNVNRPAHYTQGSIECIDAMESALTPDEFRGYLRGAIFKYNWRLGRKDEPVQEVGKIIWYAKRLEETLNKLNQSIKGGA